MLRELKPARQDPDDYPRRWFTDDRLDLIVWYDADKIIGFQLCYDKGKNEHALTWWAGHGFRHNRIDDGEAQHVTHKLTPVLIPDGVFPSDYVSDLFKEASCDIDQEIGLFVRDRLAEFGGEQ